MKPLVSVIVPVYGVEDVLTRCLDSLCRQSLSNIEIILIDDASPDKCGIICDTYAKKDVRFRVFHNKTNKGLSVTRNIGITNACSDYLMFVDSDDWVHVDFCKKAYECSKYFKADIVVFSYERIGFKKSFSEKEVSVCRVKNGYKNRTEAIELLLKGNGPGTWTTWNKLYRKQLFRHIMFPPGYLYEDIGTTYKIILQADRIYYLDEILYYNCFHAGSITTQKTQKALQDWIAMHINQYCNLAKRGYPQEKLNIYFGNVALTYCIKRKSDLSDNDYNFCSVFLQKKLDISHIFTWKRKILFYLFNYCPLLFELICSWCGKKVF